MPRTCARISYGLAITYSSLPPAGIMGIAVDMRILSTFYDGRHIGLISTFLLLVADF